MPVQLYQDPTFNKVLKDQVKEKNCSICAHRAQRFGCTKNYSGYYQCRGKRDGFKLDEDK